MLKLKEKKKTDSKLFNRYFTDYLSPSDIYKKLREAEGERNEDKVYSIKEMLNKMKEAIMCLKIKYLGLERIKK